MTRASKSRKVVVSKKFEVMFTKAMDFYQKHSGRYVNDVIDRLRDKTIPQLVKYPQMGRSLGDIELLSGFAQAGNIAGLLRQIDALQGITKLVLREIILDKNFTILYGYNGMVVVLLTLKHVSQLAYDPPLTN